MVGRKPLAPSSRVTSRKYLKPIARPTFVAPMFPEPTVRMSIPATALRDQEAERDRADQVGDHAIAARLARAVSSLVASQA